MAMPVFMWEKDRIGRLCMLNGMMTKPSVYVGESYYRGNTRPESTKNRQVWNSPATQKGLRCKDRESVIGKIESVPFVDALAICKTSLYGENDSVRNGKN